MTLTLQKIQELRGLLAKGTPGLASTALDDAGLLNRHGERVFLYEDGRCRGVYFHTKADAEAAVALHNLAPELLDAAEKWLRSQQ